MRPFTAGEHIFVQNHFRLALKNVVVKNADIYEFAG